VGTNPKHDTTAEPEVLPKQRLKRPRLFRVLLHDDDFTTMEFVVQILEDIFRHAHPDATRIMLDVHTKGIGLAGVYPHEIAETKAARVTEAARAQEFPFLCTIEPEESEETSS
jgi:ATP-dependent Clp protease adaptor protein ClpS